MKTNYHGEQIIFLSIYIQNLFSSFTVFPVISATGAFEIEMKHCNFQFARDYLLVVFHISAHFHI